MTSPTPTKISDVQIITKHFTTTKEFSEYIEEQVKLGHTYMDAIIDFCTRNGIEIESANKLVSRQLKEKIREEANARKLLSKENKRPKTKKKKTKR